MVVPSPLRMDTNECRISLGVQSSPTPAALVTARNERLTLAILTQLRETTFISQSDVQYVVWYSTSGLDSYH
jgi:hypothetical protein